MQNHQQDRRVFPRKRMSLRLEARTDKRTTHPPFDGRLRLDVCDLSLGGLAAMVDEPVISGSRMAVYFPPQHNCQGVLAGGKVVRCDRSGSRYRIGVEFDRFPAARGRVPHTAPKLSRHCTVR